MKKKMLSIIASLYVLLASFAYMIPVNADNIDNEVIIYHTNDTHGYLEGDGKNIIGIDTLAGLKEATPNSILVDAGDATQGLPLASLTKGADVIKLMNLAGYDIMTVGNHEFDYGTEQFLTNASLANFPILTANIYQNGQCLLANKQEGNDGCHTVIERNGKKIGFFGLTTVDTATSTNPAGIQDLEFKDEIATAKKEINELEAENVDAIIAICHLGDGDVTCNSEDLALAMNNEYQDKIDIIIDGHSHTIENKKVNDIMIVQTGTGMANVGKLTLTFEQNINIKEELLNASNLSDIEPKVEVTNKLQEIQNEQTTILNEVIGNTDTTLWAGQIGVVAIARLVETNYGDLAADAFYNAATTFLQTVNGKEAKMPIVAVENAGGIRAKLTNGQITNGNLIEAFPYANTLYLKVITPKILYQMMEVSGSYLNGQDKKTGMLLQETNSGGFLQIAGFNVVYDPNGQDNKVTSISLANSNTVLDRNDETTQIMLVSNNYIMNGGSGYTMLANLPKYGEADGELETIKAYLQKCLDNNTLTNYSRPQNRIQMLSEGYNPKDYTASIKIIDEDEQPLANQKLSYRIDGGIRQNGITDENGILKIMITDGGHSIRLADSQADIYVDNYAGFGIIEDQYRQMPTLTFINDGSCDPVIEEDPDTDLKQPDQGTDNGQVSISQPNDNKAGVPDTNDNTNISSLFLVALISLIIIFTLKKDGI